MEEAERIYKDLLSKGYKMRTILGKRRAAPVAQQSQAVSAANKVRKSSSAQKAVPPQPTRISSRISN